MTQPDIAELSLSRGQMSARSRDLHGVRLGDLLGEAIVGTDSQGHLWRLRCLGCGVAVFMHAGKVRQRFGVVGARLACIECMGQERGTHHHEMMRAVYREFWERWGNLYGDGWEERMRAEVLDALVSEIAPVDSTTTPDVGEPLGYDERTPRPSSSQMAAYLYPLDLDDALIRCADCGTDSDRSFGCVLCAEATCVACVRAEKHRCTQGDDGETLEAIGRLTPALDQSQELTPVVGISRERVRGIEQQALGKLRSLPWDTDDLRRSEDRERLRRMKPTRCWCSQRIATGVYCSVRCERLAHDARKHAKKTA